MDKLTQKQYDFVINYIKNGFNAYQAALDAGYSKTFARVKTQSLINHPVINQRISKAYKAVEMSQVNQLCMSIVDKARVLDRIIRAIIPLDEAEPIKLDYVKDAIRAIAELNKMQGDYAPDKRLSITVDATKERLKEVKQMYDEY